MVSAGQCEQRIECFDWLQKERLRVIDINRKRYHVERSVPQPLRELVNDSVMIIKYIKFNSLKKWKRVENFSSRHLNKLI